jgi:hypothetical protein
MDVKNSDADVANAMKVAPATSYDNISIYNVCKSIHCMKIERTGVKLKLQLIRSNADAK